MTDHEIKCKLQELNKYILKKSQIWVNINKKGIS